MVALTGLAGLFLVAAQTWLSLRFLHFIVPILVGIGGFACGIAGPIFRQTDKTRFLSFPGRRQTR